MAEIWKDVKGYEGKYQVSDEGRVRSLGRVAEYKDGRKEHVPAKMLKLSPDSSGYFIVTLYSNAVPKTYLVHRLVAIAFIPNPENKPEVNHKDRNKQKNCVTNLEWATSSENVLHAVKTGVNYSINVRHIESGQEFPSFQDCGRTFGVDGSTIAALARGKRISSYKLPNDHFEIIT